MKERVHLIFQFADSGGHQSNVSFSNPQQIIVASAVEEVIPVLKKVQNAVAKGLYAAGYVSYEAAPAFNPMFKTRDKGKMPLVWFGLFERPESQPFQRPPSSFDISDWQPSTSAADYYNGIQAIKEAIQKGETSQVNYTIRLRAKFSGDDFALYKQLSRMQTANYSAYLNMGRFRVLSASPELFFRWDGERLVARPMKGTMARGRWLEEDRAQMTSLTNSKKNRHENTMIVDLLREEIAGIAEAGSVRVPSLCEVERYPTVWQMTSTIVARTRPDVRLLDIFSALFPCGSVTGTPKKKTMSLIADLETSPREVYCGAIGFISPAGETVFNVPIRTVVIDKQTGTATYGAGGGITVASTAEEEYEEVRVKSAILTEQYPDFALLESLRLEHGHYFLWDRHLNRLTRSAEYYGYHLPIDRIRAELEEYAAQHPYAVEKVRLLVRKDGNFTIEGESLTQLPPHPPVTLATAPISRENRFLYHKTTHRAIYDEHRATHPAVFDVLLWNEAGEITEFTTGNIVLEINRKKWTPPRDSGLLAGTFRDHLIDQGEIRERVLTKEDLTPCTTVWLINSVRGWVRVKFVIPE